MSESFANLPCQACGHLIPVKLDMRQDPPTPVTTAPLCKNPGAELLSRLEEMSAAEIQQALIDRDAGFCDQLDRLICHESREARRKEAEERNRQETVLQPRQVGEDVARYGTTDVATTFDGEVTVKTPEVHDEEIVIVEPADVEDVGADKARIEISDKAKQVDRPKRLGSLKSLAFPVVPSSDPKAPFGYDDNDRPIVPARPPETEASTLFLGTRPNISNTCVHRNDPSTCFLCKWMPHEPVEPPDPRVVEEQILAEKNEKALQKLKETTKKAFGIDPVVAGSVPHVRAQPMPPKEPIWEPSKESWDAYMERVRAYGVAEIQWKAALEEWEREVQRPLVRKAKGKFVMLREVFGIQSEDVVAWLNVVIEQHPRLVDQEIHMRPVHTTLLTPEEDAIIATCRQQITALREQIAELGTRKQYDKKRRPDLDDKTRRSLKREHEREIKELNARIAKAKHTIKLAQLSIRRQQASLGEHCAEEIIPGTGHEILERTTFRELLTRGDGFVTVDIGELSAYESVAADFTQPRYKGFARFENRLIKWAIRAGVFCPMPAILERYPWIVATKAEADAEDPEVPTEDEYPEEAQLITKTGGGQIGGHIVSAGYRWSGHSFKPRGLDSFEISGQGGNNGGGDSESGWGGEVDSDDHSEDSAA